MTQETPASEAIATLKSGLQAGGYVCDQEIATVVYLARALEKPILVEGPPGVGKTELARATSGYLSLPLIRLQCYEGLDEAKALYEWKYGKQLLYTQILREKLGEFLEGTQGLEQAMERLHRMGEGFFSEQFLEPRPLLKALQSEAGAVLLIDEVDKADQEFEAFLLEILSDYQVSIPEIGTVSALHPPLIVLTSNNTREIGEALRRRCLHLHIDFPEIERERQIVETQVPGIGDNLRDQLVAFVHGIREMELRKQPAVSETIDWARTLLLLNSDSLDADTVRRTLNVIMKHEDDAERVARAVPDLLARIR
ncbi:MoxR family ATPase [Ectothiorhodospiraceae bacterium WFHF3C12]|nr:MoxR family ATPase [Ectothiorhodospiraceae bacterium WFHF3C12]